MNACLTRFESLLQESVNLEASDIHLSAGKPIYLRQYGRLIHSKQATWTEAALHALTESLLAPPQQECLRSEHSVDLAYSSEIGPRFRLNIYHERQRLSLAIRRIAEEIANFETLRLPASLDKLTTLHDGLVLITGPTGSGKSTTLNAILDRVNQKEPQHIITIEDPIEQVHDEAKSLIHQRELYTDVPSYARGIKDALREDPDIILVGEMRDPDTMRTVIAAAETGHAVYSTLHTSDAVGAINRILGGFSAAEQTSIRHQLSMVLRAVVSQRLVMTRTEDSRVPVVEILWGTKAVCNHIRTGRLEQIYTLMESGSQHGMMTREQSLAQHVQAESISLDEALRLAKDPNVLVDLLRAREKQAGESNAFEVAELESADAVGTGASHPEPLQMQP